MRAEQFAGLRVEHRLHKPLDLAQRDRLAVADEGEVADLDRVPRLLRLRLGQPDAGDLRVAIGAAGDVAHIHRVRMDILVAKFLRDRLSGDHRSEEHTSELQSLMRISYAVFCLKKKT